jgi:hypothetical protein
MPALFQIKQRKGKSMVIDIVAGSDLDRQALLVVDSGMIGKGAWFCTIVLITHFVSNCRCAPAISSWPSSPSLSYYL